MMTHTGGCYSNQLEAMRAWRRFSAAEKELDGRTSAVFFKRKKVVGLITVLHKRGSLSKHPWFQKSGEGDNVELSVLALKL